MKLYFFLNHITFILIKPIYKGIMVLYLHNHTLMNQITIFLLCLSLFFSFTPTISIAETFEIDDEKFLTRAEAIKVIIDNPSTKASHLFYPTEHFNDFIFNENCFDDLQEKWQKRYVCYALKHGYISKNESFFPNRTISLIEAAKIAYTYNAVFPPSSSFNKNWYDRYVEDIMTISPLFFFKEDINQLVKYSTLKILIKDIQNTRKYNTIFKIDTDVFTVGDKRFDDIDVSSVEIMLDGLGFKDHNNIYYDFGGGYLKVNISSIDIPSFQFISRSHYPLLYAQDRNSFYKIHLNAKNILKNTENQFLNYEKMDK